MRSISIDPGRRAAEYRVPWYPVPQTSLCRVTVALSVAHRPAWVLTLGRLFSMFPSFLRESSCPCQRGFVQTSRTMMLIRQSYTTAPFV